MDEGCWLFVNLPYALLSDTVTTVLGNLLIAKIFYACMQRPPGGQPYRLILDEARFFNTGPLDMLLETSRAYELWLTLVVQSLSQLARVRQGFLDEHLMDTVFNNVRYWSVFRDFADAAILAAQMFPLTGQKVVGARPNGEPEYQPIQAEKQEHERRLIDLGPREVLLWDRQKGVPPRAWLTPTVKVDETEDGMLDQFEADHLQRTAAPVALIRAEISARQEKVRALLASADKRKLPKADFGGPV